MGGQSERGAKVGVIGTGMVGASFAYALMQRGLANEMVLIDTKRERAVAEAMDLNHGLPFVRPVRIWAGDYSDLAGAAITVVTAGAAQQPGETRLQLLERNTAILRAVIPCMSLPSIVGAWSIEVVLQLPLSPEEEAAFRRSASPLRTRFKQIPAQ